MIDTNIHVVPKAVSNRTGESLFKLYPISSCNQLTTSSTVTAQDIIVPTVTVDDFVRENHLKRVGFIKADIEGAERLMLEGAKETLREFSPKLSICYYHRFDDVKVLTKPISDANPNYEFETKWKKIYAKVRN